MSSILAKELLNASSTLWLLSVTGRVVTVAIRIKANNFQNFGTPPQQPETAG